MSRGRDDLQCAGAMLGSLPWLVVMCIGCGEIDVSCAAVLHERRAELVQRGLELDLGARVIAETHEVATPVSGQLAFIERADPGPWLLGHRPSQLDAGSFKRCHAGRLPGWAERRVHLGGDGSDPPVAARMDSAGCYVQGTLREHHAR